MRKIYLTFLLIFLFISTQIAPIYGKENTVADKVSFFIDANATPKKITFEIVLRNESDALLNIEFPTSQIYDIVLKDKDGKEVFHLSEEKSYAQVLKHVQLDLGKAIRWEETLESHGLPEGEYEVYAELKAKRINTHEAGAITDKKRIQIPPDHPVFKNVQVRGEKGSYQVEGKACTTNENTFYTVEDGHNQQIGETKLRLQNGPSECKSFVLQVSVPVNELPQNGSLILNLYERDQEGNIIHNYPSILEIFY
ncbi:Intracellular proteinase inhibitor [Mesobacillus persicus]|uniref:Intracellular proteinase inhibitor n=1 Tax=Mesobacillus persicus TaxID=930146 RepID=A0A1H8E2T6_9BACI|nr:BsuPI-related putative proteinase inhibitor [Mesobacillus persicus]SEN13899.1 Intracellular proteinase inhibitor [Mesobacillus persicus]